MDNKPITHYERIISQPVNEFANWLARFCGMQSEDEKRNLLQWLKEGSVKKQDAIEKLSKERKTGKWIYNSEPYPLGNPYGHYDCDQCGESVPARTNFCPNCGAKMIGGDENAL